MKTDKSETRTERGWLSGPKLAYLMYGVILVAAIVVVYFVVLQYMKYQTIFTADDSITIVIEENAVDAVNDEMHPYLVVGVDSTKKVSITLTVSSQGYEMTYDSGDAVKSFSKDMILPQELFGKEVELAAVAIDRDGFKRHAQKTLTLDEEPEVLFQIG